MAVSIPAPPRRAPLSRWGLVALVLTSSVACDRVTKQLAEDRLRGAGRLSMAADTLRVEYVENRGAFLSLGADLPAPARRALLVAGVAAIVGAVLAAALFGRPRARLEVIALALIAGGGLGNLWDRLARGGAVVDFLNLGIGPLRTGIFNVADLALMAGIAALALAQGRVRPKAA
jgi:signal peptidase II